MKKILPVLFFLSIFTLTGCEGFNQPNDGGSNQQQDEYYVKYSISTRQYHYFVGVVYSDVDGENITLSKSTASRLWTRTVGPVKKGFSSYIQYDGGDCKIEVSKNNGPFVIKGEGKNSASYTIAF
jgi:GH43 family beta-xylosidase